MSHKAGVTLLEIIIVLIIIAIASVFFFPSFTTPTEKARAMNAKNNLLAIYGAEQNYFNDNGAYCLSGGNCADSLADINTSLSLNIQDDGTYTYSCSGTTCTATRTSTPSTNLVLTLNAPVNLNGGGTPNPQCNTANGWCP